MVLIEEPELPCCLGVIRIVGVGSKADGGGHSCSPFGPNVGYVWINERVLRKKD